MRKILKGLVIECKELRRLSGLTLMARIRAISDEPARERRRCPKGISRRQAKTRDKGAVEAAAAILHRAAIPFDRQAHLKLDWGRLGIGRVDMAQHLAERRVGRHD